MRIAIPYDNGEVFMHFGRTECFKVYEVEGTEVVSSQLCDTNGSGHSALAGILADLKVDVLVCGGIGDGAQAALADAGIEVCSGAEGNTDEVVAAYVKGELVSQGSNCDHHDHDHEEGGCGGDCGGGCAGCGGGCGGGAPRIIYEGKNAGKTVRTHYRGTFNDGSVFDESYGRGEPLEFICGAGQMIPGFDKAVVNMEVGEVIDIHLMPEEAYGPKDPQAIITVEIAQLPGSEDLTVDQHVYLTNMYGQPFPVVVIAKDDVNITFDANHEMAGKELNFRIELVEVL